MKLIELINLGGPVNWVLALLFLFCLTICIERIIYFAETYHTKKNSYQERLSKKINETENLPEKDKKNQLEKECTLMYYEMNRGMWLINFISAVSPSLGLLGTVTGLISAFQGMNNAGGNLNIQDLSGGIWEAMLTTAFGMIISIPALFFYRTFKRIIEKRVMRMNLMVEDALSKE